MSIQMEDTIAAIATPVGEGGIGVIRLSGCSAVAIAARLFRAANGKELTDFASHQVIFGHVVEPQTGDIVDEIICLLMRAPRSYTKEDVVELQCHGGMVVLRRILALVLENGARAAEPGEFTKRAFLNGRIDLEQAQAVMDIISAKTEASLKMASGHLSGLFSQRIEQLRKPLVAMIAHYEVLLDFPEEGVEELDETAILEQLREIESEIVLLLKTAHTGRILREGLQVAIAGKPNVGKSSLLNALLQTERAIVTDIAGTTRDSIEESANIGGALLRLVDTAGIHDTDDAIEKMGVERSHHYMQQADLQLLVFDGSRPLEEDDFAILKKALGRPFFILVNKADLPQKADLKVLSSLAGTAPLFLISAHTRDGFSQLEKAIAQYVFEENATKDAGAFVNSERQIAALKAARRHINDARNTIEEELGEDFAVIDLRSAWQQLGDILGDTANEAIIDEMFSRFCIGK